MQWLKRDLWKTGIIIISTLLLLVFTVGTPVSAADTHEMTSGLATPGTVTVQTTPMTNPTIAAQTAQEQLTKLRRENDRSIEAWLWNSVAALGTISAAFLAFLGVLWTTKVTQDKNLADSQSERDRQGEEQNHWLEDRKAEREKRTEERFQDVVEGLGSQREEARIGAAILLRTFLQPDPDYERFYIQVFDLAVVHLRLQKSPAEQSAFITVFKESFPLARNRRKTQVSEFDPRYLDASRVRLDGAYLAHVDLAEAWLENACLKGANLYDANLHKTRLRKANIEAWFQEADLSYARLEGATGKTAEELKKQKPKSLKGATMPDGTIHP
jgi:hypothetical protein